ncbi:T9SS type A sorting domain-containing protein [Bacteroidales bacterium OttesenSCG-928-E04]|nr:T9SS type A sorting domain-containing protein [Bacteroidales bacterium OttesenSCG-928-E04]
MKKILLFAIAVAFIFFATAQNQTLNKKFPRDPLAKIQPTTKIHTSPQTRSDGDWWEPDTIITFSIENDPLHRYVYEYNEYGNVTWCERQIYQNNQWNSTTMQSFFTYDHNQNVLTYTVPGDTKFIFTYDENNNRLSQEFQRLDYPEGSLLVYTYDENNNIMHITLDYSENNQVLSSYRYFFMYETFGKLSQYLAQHLNDDDEWENEIQQIYTYDENNNCVSFTAQRYRNGWGDYEKNTYTYDQNHNLLSDLYQYEDVWNSGTLTNKSLDTYTYDANNNLITHTKKEEWNEGAAEWNIEKSVTYTYDERGNMTTEIHSGLNNRCSFLYTYDENNNLLKKEMKVNLYYNDSSVEFYYIRLIYTYENGNAIVGVREFSLDGEWWAAIPENYIYSNYDENQLSLFYYNNMNSSNNTYESYNGDLDFLPDMHFDLLRLGHYKFTASYSKFNRTDNIAKPEFGTISLFPNPTTGELRIKSEESRTENVQLFDVYGKLVLETHQLQFNISHLPVGMYFVKINTENGSVTKKVVKN